MRAVAWFSCGAASAVMAKLAQERYGKDLDVVYCWTMPTEHFDNHRFFVDVEEWLGQKITLLRSTKYQTVDQVFMERRYMAGPKGAPCTVEMKKIPRWRYSRPDDINLFGFTVEEGNRIARFEENNPELIFDWILRDQKITKAECLQRLKDAGIKPPVMYSLGFRNNNCLGCVKSTSPKYWSLTREHFPEVFQRRVSQSRELNVRLVQLKGKRIFLDELPQGILPGRQSPISCGPECGTQS